MISWILGALVGAALLVLGGWAAAMPTPQCLVETYGYCPCSCYQFGQVCCGPCIPGTTRPEGCRCG